MAVSNVPIYPQLILTPSTRIQNADGTTLKALYTATLTNGSKLESIFATNTDSGAAYLLQVYFTTGGVDYLIGSVNIPASTGNTAAAPAINIIQNLPCSYDAFGNPYIYVGNGTVVKVKTTTTVATSQTVALTCTASGDF